MSEVRKILYSPGYGAGWMTWNTKYAEDFLFDAELIAAVEAGKDLGDEHTEGTPIYEFDQRLIAKHGPDAEDDAYYGGSRDLRVETVDGPFRIDEYDGNESIVLAAVEQWY